jgi:hypothetical protein
VQSVFLVIPWGFRGNGCVCGDQMCQVLCTMWCGGGVVLGVIPGQRVRKGVVCTKRVFLGVVCVSG